MAIKLRKLTAEEQTAIAKLARSRTAPAREVERARIILLASAGKRVPAIAPAHIPHPSNGDPCIFPGAFFARTAHPNRGMLASPEPERRYTKRLHPGRVVWVSCYRPSKRTRSNICPL
jgi:hypothetical protein